MISIIIPARDEIYLRKTIEDVLKKAEGEIEVIPVLDGYWPPSGEIVEDKRVRYIHNGEKVGMRTCVNLGIAISRFPYILKCDAHVMFKEGFDRKLLGDMQDNWCVVPQRRRLDPEKWELGGLNKPFIDYMFINDEYKGELWRRRNVDPALKNILIDDLMTFQGSCYFVNKGYYLSLGLLDDVNYGGSGHEAQEVCLSYWFSGGRCVVNKKTWYAHWHKTKDAPRITDKNVAKSRAYFPVWLEKHKEQYEWLKRKFFEGETTPLKKEKTMVEPKETIRNKTRYLAKRYGLEVNGTPMQIKGMLRRDMYKLFAELGYTTGAEIGVFRGRNALAMFEEIPDLKLWLVDPYGCHPASTYDGPGDFTEGKKNKFREQARQRFEDSQKYNVIGYIYNYSEIAVNQVPDNSLDFVYIDGDHSYTMAMLDIFLWSRKVKRDGVIAGHDYMYGRTREDEKAKVTQAVNGYTKAHKLPLFCTDYGEHNASRTGDNCPSFFFFKEHMKLSNREREDKTVGLVQYTDNSGDPDFMASCRRNLLKCAEQNNITETISISHQPVEGFSNNIVVDLKREVLSIFKQILIGLESAKSDIIYLCEHDMIYHPSHFEFIPPEKDIFYYDCNRYSVDDVNGHAIFYYTDVPSMMCAYRDHLIQHYKRVVKWVEKEGWSGKYGYSPPKGLPKSDRKGTRQTYMAKFPSMDVRRKESWTRKRMSKDQFRNKNSNRGWREVSQMPGWPRTEGRFQEFWRGL